MMSHCIATRPNSIVKIVFFRRPWPIASSVQWWHQMKSFRIAKTLQKNRSTYITLRLKVLHWGNIFSYLSHSQEIQQNTFIVEWYLQETSEDKVIYSHIWFTWETSWARHLQTCREATWPDETACFLARHRPSGQNTYRKEVNTVTGVCVCFVGCTLRSVPPRKLCSWEQ